MYISRTTVGDALGSDRLTALRGKSSGLALLEKVQLKEPTFSEVREENNPGSSSAPAVSSRLLDFLQIYIQERAQTPRRH